MFISHLLDNLTSMMLMYVNHLNGESVLDYLCRHELLSSLLVCQSDTILTIIILNVRQYTIISLNDVFDSLKSMFSYDKNHEMTLSTMEKHASLNLSIIYMFQLDL